MSHPADALLLSPLANSFSLYSPSSVPSDSDSSAVMFKSLAAHDPVDPESRCIPTHQLFNFSEQGSAPALQQERLSISVNPSVVTTKRSASPAPAPNKKPRTGERISTKDFIPPDVSGLTKREARLVKNRAAAFLSRQRKREEFETMEQRVAELEHENARLLALTQSDTPHQDLLSEVEELKSQLAAAMERERQLSEQLLSQISTPALFNPPEVKVEEDIHKSPELAPSPRPSAILKSGASLGLMVLLCALPTLLSMPVQNATPTSFSLPNPPLSAPSSAFDFNSFLPNDLDWTLPSIHNMMDLDDLPPPATQSSGPVQKLEFSTSGLSELDAESSLAGLDISFDATRSDNGKIRVRIHPSSSSASSRAASPGPSVSDSDLSDSERTKDASIPSSSALSALSSSLAQLSYPPPSSPDGDPFLGVGTTDDFSAEDMFNFDDPSSELQYPPASSESAKKRVRIALKSLPAAGGEGGEWEVQVC